MATIYFEKYADADTGNYTELNTVDQYELANALINILTNRKKGFPREVLPIVGEGDNCTITINTHNNSKRARTFTSDPTME